jgi:hypothetical protein
MKRLLILAFILSALYTPAYAAEDYCRYGHATAILLVDRTTQFDATDRSVFLDTTSQLIEQLGPGDRFVAYTMTGAFTDSRKLFEQCKPGCPAEGFFSGLMSACSPTLAQAQLVAFTDALATQLATMLRDPEQTPQSDLFRTVAETAHAYSTPADATRPIRTMILFSDLLENSSFLPERELRRMPVASILKRLDTAGLTPRVAGAAIHVFGFGRDDAPGRPPLPQGERRRIAEVWEQWFKAGGASDVEIGFR